MIQQKISTVNTNIQLVTDKCFSIRHRIPIWYIESYLKDRLIGLTNYFTKSSCSIDIKEEEVDVWLGLYKSKIYKAKCQYITIDNIPRILIMPKNGYELIQFTENDQEVVNKIYWLIMFIWYEKNKESSFYLAKSYEIIRSIYEKINQVLSRIKYCKMDFNDLPSDMIEEIKRKFIQYHRFYYDERGNNARHVVFKEYGYKIAEELGLIQEFLQEKSKGKDESLILHDFYKNNEDFRNKIDESVENILEHLWLSKIDSDSFKEVVIKRMQKNLKSENCSIMKNTNIVFHNEMMRILLEKNKNVTISIKIKNSKEIKANLIMTLQSKTSIINWLYGSLSEIIDYPLIDTSKIYLKDFKYNKNSCKTIHGKIKSYKVDSLVYGKNAEIDIKDVVVDCIAPKDCIIDIKAQFVCSIVELDKQNKYLWFYNDRVILNRLLELCKIVNRMIEVCKQIDGKLLLAFSIMT